MRRAEPMSVSSFMHVRQCSNYSTHWQIIHSAFLREHEHVLVAQCGWAAYIFWPLYGFIQGTIAVGFWVIAHECGMLVIRFDDDLVYIFLGHQAFSPYGWLNDTVGFIIHSLLLVPYFSWKYSHAIHHQNTGHIDRDQV